jgi:hypothetical protein
MGRRGLLAGRCGDPGFGGACSHRPGRDRLRAGREQGLYKRVRSEVGRAVLLGLEVLIIADIVLTVTIDQTIESAVTLGIIVLVRTFLSFSLEIEMDGTVPWRRTKAERQAAA